MKFTGSIVVRVGFARSCLKAARLFSTGKKFEPQQAVILSKLTRFEYEQIRHQDLDEDELKNMVSMLQPVDSSLRNNL